MMQLLPPRRSARRAGVAAAPTPAHVETDPAKWPFLQIVDASQRDLGWCGFAGPLRESKHRRHYEHLARSKYRFIGFCSHGEFPNENWIYPCEAWCHGYRDPERRLPPDLPQVMLSESDFADAEAINRAASGAKHEAIVADYVVVALPGWPEKVKRPSLAKACTWELARLGFRGLFVGLSVPEGVAPGTLCVSFLPWHVLMASIAHARFVLFTSEVDGSPRLITESLCLNKPVLLPSDLLQGWKYCNDPGCGEFYSGSHDVAVAAIRLLSHWRKPFERFHRQHGWRNASAHLFGVLRGLQPDLKANGDIARIVRR
jgi:hypothetical protein